MKRIVLLLLALTTSGGVYASGVFSPSNYNPSSVAITGGTINSVPVTSIQNPSSVAITGGTIDGTAIGATTPSTGKFSSVLSNSPSGGIGYMTGAGGSVTQTTNISTAVTLNTIAGRITTVSYAFTAGTFVSFILNNSNIGANDILLLSGVSGGIALLTSYIVGAGSAQIYIYPLTTLTISNVINFAIIKAASS